VREKEFNVNTAAVTKHGLPRLIVPARSRLAPAPTLPGRLVAAHASGLLLEARVVDFWTGSQGTRAAIASWLTDLGFDVRVTSDCEQIGPACGYVAARATNLMFAAGNEWRSVDVSDAADEYWIERGNEILENGEIEAEFLESREVEMLTQVFREDAVPEERRDSPWRNNECAFPCLDWPLTVGSLDWVARKLSDALIDYINSGAGAPPRCITPCRPPTWVNLASLIRHSRPLASGCECSHRNKHGKGEHPFRHHPRRNPSDSFWSG